MPKNLKAGAKPRGVSKQASKSKHTSKGKHAVVGRQKAPPLSLADDYARFKQINERLRELDKTRKRAEQDRERAEQELKNAYKEQAKLQKERGNLEKLIDQGSAAAGKNIKMSVNALLQVRNCTAAWPYRHLPRSLQGAFHWSYHARPFLPFSKAASRVLEVDDIFHQGIFSHLGESHLILFSMATKRTRHLVDSAPPVPSLW